MKPLRLSLFSLLVVGIAFASEEEVKKAEPKYKLSKEISYVLEPLDKEGYIDYETAVNMILKGKSTPDSNAVVLIMKCLGPKPEGAELKPDFYKWLGVEAPPEDGVYLNSSHKFFEAEYKGEDSQAFFAFESQLRRRPWTEKDSPKHVEWLKVNEKPLAIAIEASKRKDYFHPLIARRKDGKRGMLLEALLPMVQKCREIAFQLSFRATLRLGNGQIEAACEDLLAIHRLGRLISRGGSLIEMLLGVALQAVAHNGEIALFEHGNLTAKQALAYQAELLKLAPMSTVGEKINRFERFSYLDAAQGLVRFGDIGIPGVEDVKGMTPEEMAKAIDLEVVFRIGNKWFDSMDEMMKKPTRAERIAACAELNKEIEALMKQRGKLNPNVKPEKLREQISTQIGNVLIGLLLPAFEKVGEASDRSEQIHRNGLLLTALAACRADEKNYPEKLDALVPKYLAKIPEDVFSGKAILYRRTEKGFLLYSVGLNGKDDEGKLITDDPRIGDDVGVRVGR